MIPLQADFNNALLILLFVAAFIPALLVLLYGILRWIAARPLK